MLFLPLITFKKTVNASYSLCFKQYINSRNDVKIYSLKSDKNLHIYIFRLIKVASVLCFCGSNFALKEIRNSSDTIKGRRWR